MHLLILLGAALVTLVLPLVYVILVQGIGVFLGWKGFLAIKTVIVTQELPMIEVFRLAGLLIAAAAWACMVRPLLPAERRRPAAMQVSKNTQPSLFAVIETLCRALQVRMPSEVWLDCTGGARTSLRAGVRGAAGGDRVLHLGMPLVGVLSARELAAVLAMEIGQCSGSMGATLTHIVRETNAWLFRALYQRDPWEEALKRKPVDDESVMGRVVKLAVSGFVWTSQRPFWLVMMLARVAGFLPMYVARARLNQCAVRLIGVDGFDRLQHKRRHLATSMKQARKKVDEGVSHARLPENFSLLVARLFTTALDAAPPLATRKGSTANPPAAHLIEQLPSNAEAAALIRGFVDLARQISAVHYQHALGIAIHRYRMVAQDETIYHKRHQAEALGVIRRYFGGLMHPERALCGLAITGGSTDVGDLAQEVIKCRQWEKQYENQIRMALREWNLAWQRRRDFECAWVLTLAGYAVCRLDYGTAQSNPDAYRKEAKAQRMIMDHLDDPLRMCESHLEKRFAAALGMLWYSQTEILPDRLVEMRKQMPLWASVFESLAAVLPEFRELLTSFYSFQTLGGRIASASDPGAFAGAMQSIVPGMMARARHIAQSLDGACYPFNPDGVAVPLADYLCASMGGSAPPDPLTAHGMHAMARQMAQEASAMLTPFVDRFLELYHRSFAWLAATAEASEHYFVGPADSAEVISSEVESLAGLIKTEIEMRERTLAMA
jgi:hypothetical protein